jgi:hypothetical protein
MDLATGPSPASGWNASMLPYLPLAIFLSALPPVSVFSLALGFVPEVAAAVLYVLFLRRLTNRNPGAAVRAAVGGALGSLVGVLFQAGTAAVVALLDGRPPKLLVGPAMGFLAAGAVAGALAAATVGARAYARLTSRG